MTLEELRSTIDKIDDNMLLLLSLRVRYALEARKIKLVEGLPIHDDVREAEILSRVAAKAAEYGLESSSVRTVFATVLTATKDLAGE